MVLPVLLAAARLRDTDRRPRLAELCWALVLGRLRRVDWPRW